MKEKRKEGRKKTREEKRKGKKEERERVRRPGSAQWQKTQGLLSQPRMSVCLQQRTE